MNNCTTIEFEEIIEMFSPKINKCIQNTPFQERENIEQEIKIKILEKSLSYKKLLHLLF